MHDLLMAIVKDLNFTTSIAVIATVVGVGIWATNRQWANTTKTTAEFEHKRKMFELETERCVKLDRLSVHPAADENRQVIEHRKSDGVEEG